MRINVQLCALVCSELGRSFLQHDTPAEDDFRVESVRKHKLQPYDKMMKAFSYAGALDAALATQLPMVREALAQACALLTD